MLCSELSDAAGKALNYAHDNLKIDRVLRPEAVKQHAPVTLTNALKLRPQSETVGDAVHVAGCDSARTRECSSDM